MKLQPGVKASAFLLIKRSIKRMSKILPEKLREKLCRYRPFRFLKEKPYRSQRVFLQENIQPQDFFKKLDHLGVEYVLLRWWEKLPAFPEYEDINILIPDKDRYLINDLVTHEGQGTKCDIYTVRGGEDGSRNSIPVFPYYLSKALLEHKIFFNGAWIPSALPYFASVAYHAIFHKGHNSGVPGFGLEPTKYVFDYRSHLKELAHSLNLKVEINVESLYQWLKDKNFAPGEDTLTKLVEERPELAMLQSKLFSDIRGGEMMVFVIRERLYADGFLQDFRNFLEQEYKFDILDVKELTQVEKLDCYNLIRGGKWDRGPYLFSGGPPVAFLIAFDYSPTPLSPSIQKSQTRMTNNNNLAAKYAFREYVRKQKLKDGDFNGLHSADNEQDALFYISILGKDYQEKIIQKTEKIRNRIKDLRRIEKTEVVK